MTALLIALGCLALFIWMARRAGWLFTLGVWAFSGSCLAAAYWLNGGWA